MHHPPLESIESHAGGAALKVCQRGEAPGPGLESPIATQSRRQRDQPRPEQEQSRAVGRRGQAPSWQLAVHQHAALKTTQILFHSETRVGAVDRR